MSGLTKSALFPLAMECCAFSPPLPSCLFAGSALAERRVALVIGEDGYKTIRKLDNAVDDAKSVGDTLEQLGFEVTLETNRDLKRVRRALDDFREDGAGADVALVYFAGHGVEISGDNRLLPIDADASSLDALEGFDLAAGRGPRRR